MEELFQVGSITQTHGIRGEVKVFPMTDDITRFKNMKNLLLDGGKEGYISLEVESVRQQKNLVILKFKGIDNINDIERFKGKGLFVEKSNRVKLKKDEYFIADLMGIRVFLDTDTENVFGHLEDVLQTGANDVYEIKMENGKTVLVPAIKECVVSIDVEDDKMVLHLLDGLLEV